MRIIRAARKYSGFLFFSFLACSFFLWKRNIIVSVVRNYYAFVLFPLNTLFIVSYSKSIPVVDIGISVNTDVSLVFKGIPRSAVSFS